MRERDRKERERKITIRLLPQDQNAYKEKTCVGLSTCVVNWTDYNGKKDE